MAPPGSVLRIDRDFHDGKAAFECLDRHLCLGFKTAAEQRDPPHDTSRKNAVTREQVGEPNSEDAVEQETKEPIAQSISKAEFTVCGMMQSRSDHHIRFATSNRFN